MNEFIANATPLRLERFPPLTDDPLQAWDAADELLHQAHQLPDGPVWILNDHFGALACAFATDEPARPLHWINDSFVAHQAVAQNLELNDLPPLSGCYRDMDELAEQPLPAGVVIKLPRSLRLLTWQLDWLNQHLPAGTPVVIGARQKEMPSTLPNLTRTLLDEVHPSRAVKKARLVYGQLSGRHSGMEAVLSWPCEEIDQEVINYPNTYGSQRLDIGARLLLKHLPASDGLIVDLGCGNGVLSVAALKANPDCRVLAVDESWHGIRACRDNTAEFGERIEILWNDCLSEVEGGSADLVLCNPPFHQQQAVTDHIAWQMFRDARRVLKMGGRLRIVGNRHLGYHIKLARLFGGCQTIASNAKFVVLEAQKR
ncbi:methyltransferase [Ferrimonas gelatinilytica]|uniref:Ribosomal RNA large subunit methyltransferase G n=1 Tax=Ferrimonas gelatinilytica TaxID=1255257 RepID=A0ABP9S2S1_9GAMM